MYSKLFVLCCAFLAACSAPGIPPEKEYAQALKASQDLVAEYGSLDNTWMRQYLGSIGAQLVRSLPYPEPRNPKYDVSVLNTDQSLAFSPGSGFILISKGLILSMKNEGELAFVMAHEISHQELSHTAFSGPDHGRPDEDLEHSADTLAAATTARAGYNPYDSIPSIIHAAVGREDLRQDPASAAAMNRRIESLRSFIRRSKWGGISMPLPQRDFLHLQEILRRGRI